jgi:hypothetical protein
MNDQTLPQAATDTAENGEDRFFDALAAGDVGRIADLLHEEFVIVDVMSGGVAARESFLAALRDRVVEFDRVVLVERTTRRWGVSRSWITSTMTGARGRTGASYPPSRGLPWAAQLARRELRVGDRVGEAGGGGLVNEADDGAGEMSTPDAP